MAQLLDVQTKKLVDVPDEQVPAALASRAYQVPVTEHTTAQGQIRAIDTDTDEAVLLKPERALEALQSGKFRLRQHEDDYRDMLGSVKGFGLGVAKGLTLGLAKPLLDKMGVPTDVIELANPIAEPAGQVAGIVGSLLVPGEGEAAAADGATTLTGDALRAVTAAPRAVTSLGTATAERAEGLIIKSLTGGAPAGIATRALAKAVGTGAQGALESSIWRAGQIVSEQDLGDPGAVAQALVAGVGPAAIWGGTFGAALGGASVLGGAAFEKLTDVASSNLRKIAGNSRVQNAIDEFSEEATYKAVGLTPAQAARAEEGRPGALATLHDENVLPDGAIIKRSDTVKQTVSRLKQATRQWGQEIGDIWAEADSLAAAARPSGHLVDAEELTTKLTALREELAAHSTPAELAPVDKVIKSLEDKELLTGTELKALWKDLRSAKNYATRRAVQALVDTANEEVQALAQETGNTALWERLQKANGYYSKLVSLKAAKEIARHAGAGEVGEAFDRGLGHTGLTGIGLVTGGIHGAATGAALSVAKHILKPQASTIADVANKVANLATLQNQIMKVQGQINKAVRGFVEAATNKSVTFAAPAIGLTMHDHTKEKDTQKAALKLIQQMQQHDQNPAGLVDNMTAATHGLMEHAPNVTQEIAKATARGFKMVHAAAQDAAPPPDPLQPNLKDNLQLPDKDAAQKLARIYHAVNKPMDVVKRLATGAITPEEMTVLKTVYPSLYALISAQMVEELSKIHTRIPYAARQTLSTWLGTSTDRTLTGDFLRRAQSVYQNGAQPAPGGASGPPPKTSTQKASESSPKTAKLYQTPSQRIAAEIQ